MFTVLHNHHQWPFRKRKEVQDQSTHNFTLQDPEGHLEADLMSSVRYIREKGK